MKYIKIHIQVLVLIVLLSACASEEDPVRDNVNNDEITDIDTEDKVLKAITGLPEYHEAEEHIKALTAGEQSLSFIIYPPDEENNKYYIQLGYNQESWFETYYHFHVDPETYEVFITDIITGDVVPIETWRKREELR